MTKDTLIETAAGQAEQHAAPALVPPATPEVVPLPEVLRQIGRDSRKNPGQYLDETTVPFGGE